MSNLMKNDGSVPGPFWHLDPAAIPVTKTPSHPRSSTILDFNVMHTRPAALEPLMGNNSIRECLDLGDRFHSPRCRM